MILALLLTFAVFAQSQPPSPRQSVPAQTQQDKSSREKKVGQPNNGPSSPTTAESETPTGTDGNQAKNAGNAPAPKYRFLGASITDWLLATLTLCLVIVGGIQIFIYRKQAEYMRVTNAVAHRPKLNIKFMSLTKPALSAASTMEGSFLVFNIGQSDTTLRRTYSEVVIAPRLPASYSSGDIQMLPDQLRIAPGDRCILRFPSGAVKEFTTENYIPLASSRHLIRSGQPDPDGMKLFLIGWIEYSDDAGKTRRFGFCRRYNWVTERFDRESDPDYEYGDQA